MSIQEPYPSEKQKLQFASAKLQPKENVSILSTNRELSSHKLSENF